MARFQETFAALLSRLIPFRTGSTSGKLDELIAVIKQKYTNGKTVAPNDTPENREGLFYDENKLGFRFVLKWKTSASGIMASLEYKRPDSLWDDVYKKYREKVGTAP